MKTARLLPHERVTVTGIHLSNLSSGVIFCIIFVGIF